MFYNTWKLTRFMLRRERTTSTAWLVAMVATNFLVVLLMGFVMLADAPDRQAMLEMLENPALLAMVGPIFSGALPAGRVLYDFTALYTLFMLVMMGITVGIMNIFLVIRHTRADEEAGRYEVLRSLPAGRLANLHAAMVTAVIVNAISAAAFALSMWAGVLVVTGYSDIGGALLWGVNMGVIGFFFAAVAALFSQMSSSSRGAASYSFLTLGLFYILRAAGDMNPEQYGVLAWFSPFGMMSRSWPYLTDTLWPVLLIVVLSGAFGALAYKICAVRDIDQGILPDRPGRPRGGLLMRSVFGLHTRLLRRSIIVWVLILFGTGAAYSVILADIEMFIAGNEMYRNLMLGPTGLLPQIEGATPEEVAEIMNYVLSHAGYNIVQLFANMIGFIMAMITLIPVLMFVLKARSEEKAARTEMLLAAPLSRTHYLAGLLFISGASALVLQTAQALGLWVGGLLVLPDTSDLPFRFVMESALVYVPALWFMGGLAALLVGRLPQRTGWIWGYYGLTFFLLMFGRLDMFPEWLVRVTPLGSVPMLPIDTLNAGWLLQLAGMAVMGAALAGLGLVYYKKRDINAVTH